MRINVDWVSVSGETFHLDFGEVSYAIAKVKCLERFGLHNDRVSSIFAYLSSQLKTRQFKIDVLIATCMIKFS